MQFGYSIRRNDRRFRKWTYWVEGSDKARGLVSYTGDGGLAFTERGAHHKGSRAALKAVKNREKEIQKHQTISVKPWEGVA